MINHICTTDGKLITLHNIVNDVLNGLDISKLSINNNNNNINIAYFYNNNINYKRSIDSDGIGDMIIIYDNKLDIKFYYNISYAYSFETKFYNWININCNPSTISSLRVLNIMLGYDRMFIHMDNGDLMGLGSNSFGQLGLGEKNETITPRKILNDIYINFISCSYSHTLVSNKKGDIYVFGSNESGQLGLGHSISINEPKLLEINKIIDTSEKTESIIKNIDCGKNHTIIHYKNGKIYGFGSNRNFQLGLNEKKSYDKPTLLFDSSSNIRDIICCSNGSIIYKYNGDVIVFGNDILGQLGSGSPKIIYEPTKIMNDKSIIKIIFNISSTIIYKNNGDLSVCGYNIFKSTRPKKILYTPKLIVNIKNISFLNGYQIYKFSPENYDKICIELQEYIYLLYLCLKCIQYKHNIKLPKFIIYEIIKFI